MLKVNLNNSEITAIIVIFNVTNVIIKCLEQLKDIPVIIVDNGKSNQEIISKIKKFKNIKKILHMKVNNKLSKLIKYFNLINHNLIFSENKIKIYQYWKPQFNPVSNLTYSDVVENIKEKLI